VDRVPPNVQFQIDDCELDWTFQKESFDYIHIRGMQLSCKDWPLLMKQAYQYVPCSTIGGGAAKRLLILTSWV
jgi:hypothetical protein